MNLQLGHVLSQITGLSGEKFLDAILAGERDRATGFEEVPKTQESGDFSLAFSREVS
jgi:hypothetical protein